VELLHADYQGSTPASNEPPPKHTRTRKLEPPISPDADDAAALAQVVAYYHDTLKQSPEALEYLESRGLRSPEMIDHFNLGFANRTLGYRLPASNRKAGAELRGRLESLGIIRESGHEQFNGGITIPIFDEAGQVVGCTRGRSASGCAKGRRCTSICQDHIEECGTSRRCRLARRSSSARRCSTR
jgi:hypothetical protein